MKTLLAVLLLLAEPRDAKDDLQRAIQKLAEAESFSWMAMTIEESDVRAPEEAEWFEGQCARSGWRKVSKPGSKATEDAWLKDDRIALRTPDGWKAIDLEVVPGQKPDKLVRRAQEFHQTRDPLVQARILAGRSQSLVRHEDGLISGQVAALDASHVLEHALTSGNKIPEGAALRVNYRIKDGVLASYELVVTYKSIRGRDQREIENLLSMAVEFSEVGTTAVEVPEEARKALQ